MRKHCFRICTNIAPGPGTEPELAGFLTASLSVMMTHPTITFGKTASPLCKTSSSSYPRATQPLDIRTRWSLRLQLSSAIKTQLFGRPKHLQGGQLNSLQPHHILFPCIVYREQVALLWHPTQEACFGTLPYLTSDGSLCLGTLPQQVRLLLGAGQST